MANPAFVYNPPVQPYLTILYQDDDILVANKPSGLLSVPGRGEHLADCMLSRLQAVPMSEWSEAQVLEWTALIDLPLGCAEAVRSVFAKMELDGDDSEQRPSPR